MVTFWKGIFWAVYVGGTLEVFHVLARGKITLFTGLNNGKMEFGEACLFIVHCSLFRVQGSLFRVWGLGFGVRVGKMKF